MLDPNKPYCELPLLPPTAELQSAPVLLELVAAAASIAKLSASAESLPNPNTLYENIMLMEAKDSSEIENIVTTTETLFQTHAAKSSVDPMTKEVHQYAQAIHLGWKHERPLCTNVTEEICTLIKGSTMQVRKIPGTKIASGNRTIYTPPDGETLLRDLLDNLFDWMNADDDVHTIIKAAISHYQFESIHPFLDGNGRTGRIIFVLYLVEQGLLSAPVLFLSGEILAQKNDYYRLLQQSRETNDFEEYLIWFLKAVTHSSNVSTLRVMNIKDSMLSAKHMVRTLLPKIYTQELINVLFVTSFIFAEDLIEASIVKSKTSAHRYLKELDRISVIQKLPERLNGRDCYRNIALYDALRIVA